MRTPRLAFATLLLLVCAVALAACLLDREAFLPGTALVWMRGPIALLAVALGVRFAARRAWVRLGGTAALFAVLVGEWSVGLWRQADPPRLGASAPTFTVVTHNLLYRGARLSPTLATLSAEQADLIALQEVTPEWVAALGPVLAERYPFRALSPQNGTLGYAVYSRHPLRDVRYLGPDPRRAFAQCMNVDLPDGPLALCNVHFYSVAGEWRTMGLLDGLEANAEVRGKQWAAVRWHLDHERAAARQVLLGDLNTMESDPLHRTITRHFVDAYRHLRVAPGTTFPSRVRRLPMPLVRIDYVFTRGPLAPVEAEVLRHVGSDHLAVRSRLLLGEARALRAAR